MKNILSHRMTETVPAAEMEFGTEINNTQTIVALDLPSIAEFADKVAKAVEETGGRCASVAFVDDIEMSRLNNDFRGKNETTDVLSFPDEPSDVFAEEILGEIVISAEQAAKQATEHGLPLELEIRQLLLHGTLHLCGYDHETDDGRMNARELELREQLGIE